MNTIKLGDLEVRRMGFGAMQLPGKGAWGEPKDPAAARAVLRRAVELGVNLIDTAWYYGPHVSNRLIAEVLHPYPKDLVIATKLGGMRPADGSWGPYARPDEIRKGAEEDLRGLKLDRLDVVHMRYMPSSGVPLMESVDAILALQKEGKVRHLALSCVDAAQLEAVLKKSPVVSVQNVYSVTGGGGQLAKYAHASIDDPDAVLAACEKHGIAFLPFFPLGAGGIGELAPALAKVAARHGASVSQIALAWLMARSPVMTPIPGTSSVKHLEENWAAQNIALSAEDLATLSGR